MSQLEKIITSIKSLERPSNHPIIVAISGFGGSGKSTLAGKLKDQLGDAEIVSIDDFITNRLDKRSDDWEGFDRNRFIEEVLRPAKQGKEIRYQEYNWPEDKIIGWKTVPQSEYLIVEGCSLLHPDLISYYDNSIWIDFPLEEATARGMARDRSWGVDHDEMWRTVWMPNEQDFLEKYRPDRLATCVHKESRHETSH